MSFVELQIVDFIKISGVRFFAEFILRNEGLRMRCSVIPHSISFVIPRLDQRCCAALFTPSSRDLIAGSSVFYIFFLDPAVKPRDDGVNVMRDDERKKAAG